MADDGDWFAGGDDDLPPAPGDLPPLPGSKRASLIAEAEAAAAAGVSASDVKAALGGADDRPVAEDEFLDPDKLLLCKHWIR